jgi:hypothetical protein
MALRNDIHNFLEQSGIVGGGEHERHKAIPEPGTH